MDQRAYLVSWNEDEAEFVVFATTEDEARAQFLANREAAGAMGGMREDAARSGIEDVAEGVLVRLLVPSPHGHGVHSVDY